MGFDGGDLNSPHVIVDVLYSAPSVRHASVYKRSYRLTREELFIVLSYDLVTGLFLVALNPLRILGK